MAHSPKHYTEMGRLVADAGKRDWEELTAEYGAMLMEGLGMMGTRGKQVNVLQHLMGFLKNHLSSEDNAYLGSRVPGPHRGLPAGAAAADRAADTAQASPEPLPGARVGAPAGVSQTVSQGADAAESCIGERSGYEVLARGVFDEKDQKTLVGAAALLILADRFVLWASTAAKPMPEALAALESDDQFT